MRDVRDRIQLTVFTNAGRNRAAAAKYLSGLASARVGYHDQRTILTSPGTLAGAAPKEYVDFALATIIEKDDPDDWHSRRHRYGPFGAHATSMRGHRPARALSLIF
jgi:hypothetical protein